MTDVESVLARLTLEEKVRLVSGASAWRTHAIERVGVPVLKVSDGPNGIRGDGGVAAASFPVGICMGATWNTDLVRQVGGAVAGEAISKDVQVVLGPTINIHRTPIGGRNFECYSEDPHLSGTLAAAFTDGAQAEGVGACLKHYVCNDSEFERHSISSEVDERTLREIYLRPFEIAIRASRPLTVMAAYNRINGVYACSHDYLINDVLKGEWAFDGLVMSDWGAANETVGNALGGLDLEMPGPARTWGAALLEAVGSGDVTESVLDDKVRRLLRVLDWTGRFDNPEEAPERAVDTPERRQIAYQAAAEGMVLLKNDGVLPLAEPKLKRLAVIGPNVHDFRIMGGGSSSLKPHYVVSPLEALAAKLPGTEIVTAVGCRTHKYVPGPEQALLSPGPESAAQGLRAQFFEDGIDSELVAERVIGSSTVHLAGKAAGARSAVLAGFYAADSAGEYEFGVLSTGKARLYVKDQLVVDNWEDTEPGEAFFGQASTERRGMVSLKAGEQASLRIEFEVGAPAMFRALRYGVLPPAKDGIAEAAELAESADAVLLLVGTNDDWETEGNDRETLALPGEQDQLLARVLAANANAVVVNNSGSPVSMPWLDTAPAVIQCWFAGQEFGNALVDILLGTVNPSGKLPISFPQCLEDTPAFTSYPGEFGKVHYGEGLFVGYRWYESRNIAPLLAFGHGLSYTTFDYRSLTVGEAAADGSVQVTFTLANAGEHAGKETAQVYVEAHNSPVTKPRIELGAFAKTDLEVGEVKKVSLTLAVDAFSHWDVGESAWVAPHGEYSIHVGSSSRDLRLSAVATI